MLLSLHEVRGFRCLTEVRFEPAPGLNLVRGRNAQGKTSLLESILFVATSKSHRTAQERELLLHEAESFHLRTVLERRGTPVTLEANWWRGTKRFKVNGVPQQRMSDILGQLNVVLFSPEDVDIVKGGASARRRFMDMELAQVDKGYLNALQLYRQVLRQRNELLKRPKPDRDLLRAWEPQFVESGRAIMESRGRFLEELAAIATETHASIGGGEALQVRYEPDVKQADQLQETLDKYLESDLRRQQTTRGPHRDDIGLFIAERPARDYGSQGQQKTAALAMRLAVVELVRQRTGEYPVLMLDEVLAELDADRCQRLFLAIPEAVQCIATTTQLEGAPAGYAGDFASFLIEGGRLERR
ncbi:MAG: DNA replication/repair protein RecF [Candidatus Hydrogenedens sp.]|nr:DNA replication/repair protein RecF [Candidatus Hydrogenedens sp.]